MKKRSYTFVIILVLILIVIPIAYYYPRLRTLKAGQILDLFVAASNLKALTLTFFLTNLGIFLTSAAIDLIAMGWKNSAFRRLFFIRNVTARGDLWCWLLTVFSLFDLFALLFSFGFFYVLSSVIVKAGGFSPIHLIPHPLLQFAVIFCLGDIKHYFWHRFMHTDPFWELHKFHHSATEFNLITNSRGHFIEKGVLMVFDSVLFSLFGAPIEYFAAFLIIKEFYDQLLHSDLNWSWGWVGRYILMSPRAHRIHHSNASEFYDKNFGTTFIFWDKLFGTYARTDKEIRIGLDDSAYNQKGFWFDMVEGTRAFASASAKLIRKRSAKI
jgi:sterol desaturase/sphingolipid hydroxylase (fatty acid hydroxylase superfamily)